MSQHLHLHSVWQPMDWEGEALCFKISESVLTLSFACQSMREFGLWNREGREGGVGVQLQFEYIFTLLSSAYYHVVMRED